MTTLQHDEQRKRSSSASSDSSKNENPFMALIDAAASLLETKRAASNSKAQVQPEDMATCAKQPAHDEDPPEVSESSTDDVDMDTSSRGETKDMQNGSKADDTKNNVIPGTKEDLFTDPSKKMTFAEILMDVLDDPKNANVLAWCPDGKAFMIVNHKKFTMDQMPKLFQIRNMSSFVRKLGRWGFSRVHEKETRNSDIFKHEFFRRGQKELCRKKVKCIGRVTATGASPVNGTSNISTCPSSPTVAIAAPVVASVLPKTNNNSNIHHPLTTTTKRTASPNSPPVGTLTPRSIDRDLAAVARVSNSNISNGSAKGISGVLSPAMENHHPQAHQLVTPPIQRPILQGMPASSSETTEASLFRRLHANEHQLHLQHQQQQQSLLLRQNRSPMMPASAASTPRRDIPRMPTDQLMNGPSEQQQQQQRILEARYALQQQQRLRDHHHSILAESQALESRVTPSSSQLAGNSMDSPSLLRVALRREFEQQQQHRSAVDEEDAFILQVLQRQRSQHEQQFRGMEQHQHDRLLLQQRSSRFDHHLAALAAAPGYGDDELAYLEARLLERKQLRALEAARLMQQQQLSPSLHHRSLPPPMPAYELRATPSSSWVPSPAPASGRRPYHV